jgi:hypothetical protein
MLLRRRFALAPSSFMLLLSLAAVTHAGKLIGTVRSSSGRPLPGVTVATKCEPCVETKTDGKGWFRLPEHGRVVFFRHPDFRPLSKVLDLGVDPIEVVLQDKGNSEWRIPNCQGMPSKEFQSIGFISKLLVPRGPTIKKIQDSDYVLYVIHNRYPTAQLEIWFGLSVTNGYPPEELLLLSREFTERSWTCTLGAGVDLNGRLRSGEFWRWTTLAAGVATYRTKSEQVAKSFDKIINSECCSVSPTSK